MNTPVFLGIDLGWYGKPSGLAAVAMVDGVLTLQALDRIADHHAIIEWVRAQIGDRDAVAGVDAPLVIPNATGTRLAEQALNRDFRRFHAGCHAANLGLPFAPRVLAFSAALAALGFAHAPMADPQSTGRFQIEVHPHAASVSLFGLPRIVKYKRGTRAERGRGLAEFRRLLRDQLPSLDPPFSPLLPSIPRKGDLKTVEDRIDAVFCAYIAAYWWHSGRTRNRVYGDAGSGYVVVPLRGSIPESTESGTGIAPSAP